MIANFCRGCIAASKRACTILIGLVLSATAAAEWPKHGLGDSEQRFSPLKLINDTNVEQLGLSWSVPTGTRRGMEATPIIVDGVMYVSTAWSRVMALNARNGETLWHYDPNVDGAKARDACCDVVNRGVAVSGDQVFIGALDGRLIALDRRTGKENWSTQTTDTNKPYTITGAPRVIRNLVIIGNGGAEFGVRGYFSAYHADTGELLWRFYTVPSQDESADAAQPSLAVARRTWADDSLWESGLGGTAWDSFAYDESLNLLYAGVGNASQYNRAVRSPGGGDNLFVASILAVNPDTGRLVWHYQTTPADSWDYTATQHMILAELNWLGEQRQVLMQAPKNGFFYVLDRATGELLAADKYVHVNWASHVDIESGRPVETEVADWSSESRMISPAIVGGHNWHPMSYSPDSGLVYIPTIHTTYPFQADPDFRFNPHTMNTGEDFPALLASAPPFVPQFCSPTRLTAWDPVAREAQWEVRFDNGVSAGVLSTAGNLVFQGTTAGDLVAYDARKGTELWRATGQVGIMAPPVTYTVDGQQFVAVVAGIGGSQGGHNTVMSHENDGQVLAFALGGSATPPKVRQRLTEVHAAPRDFPRELSETELDRGRELYAVHCVRCHGFAARSSGLYPDLRYSNEGVHAIWKEIVLDGVFASRGMASFAESLDENDVRAIHGYVIGEAIRSQQLSHRAGAWLSQRTCIPASWLAD